MQSPLDTIPLACPIDGSALRKLEHGLVCDKSHSFDISRHGYVNLLPVQYKSSRDPGDSKSMVDSRRLVLEEGHFVKVSAALSDMACEHARSIETDSGLLIDAGCGEGYYTAHMADHLSADQHLKGMQVLGIDISKWAILVAAKRYDQIGWAVATNKHLPILPDTVDIITSLFGFETWQPWSELQKSRQLVIVADAGPGHLMELRELIYPEVRIHEVPPAPAALSAGYSNIREQRVTYSTHIPSAQSLNSLLYMTPHAHRANAEALERIKDKNQLQLTIDILIRVYQRC